MSDPLMKTYLAYLLISIAMTIWVARTLFVSGRRFLIDVFDGDDNLADSVNRLLVVGFYLINLGYVALAMRVAEPVLSGREALEALSYKVGLVLFVLGAMHFANLSLFGWLRRRRFRVSSDDRTATA